MISRPIKRTAKIAGANFRLCMAAHYEGFYIRCKHTHTTSNQPLQHTNIKTPAQTHTYIYIIRGSREWEHLIQAVQSELDNKDTLPLLYKLYNRII